MVSFYKLRILQLFVYSGVIIYDFFLFVDWERCRNADGAEGLIDVAEMEFSGRKFLCRVRNEFERDFGGLCDILNCFDRSQDGFILCLKFSFWFVRNSGYQ